VCSKLISKLAFEHFYHTRCFTRKCTCHMLEFLKSKPATLFPTFNVYKLTFEHFFSSDLPHLDTLQCVCVCVCVCVWVGGCCSTLQYVTVCHAMWKMERTFFTLKKNCSTETWRQILKTQYIHQCAKCLLHRVDSPHGVENVTIFHIAWHTVSAPRRREDKFSKLSIYLLQQPQSWLFEKFDQIRRRRDVPHFTGTWRCVCAKVCGCGQNSQQSAL